MTKKKITRSRVPDILSDILVIPDVFLNRTASKGRSFVPIEIVRTKQFDRFLVRQSEAVRNYLSCQGFSGKAQQFCLLFSPTGTIEKILLGVGETIGLYDICALVERLQKLPDSVLQSHVFSIEGETFTEDSATNLATGWALACYRFSLFRRSSDSVMPCLVWPQTCNRERVLALISAICAVRTLINLPANHLGPEELAQAAQQIASATDSQCRIVVDAELLAQNFPLIHAVGDGSARRPRLIDLTWGNPKHPKVTVVGKGVCFDTGGYDLKPSAAMLLMKKDMGGAAMALGLMILVARLKLPIRLRVLIPAVENSVSGQAYRPMDILTSRKGSTVEIHNTDAEGRLVMADCLTLACEENPDLLVDYSTLTGAARSALGYDLPALFSNREDLAHRLSRIGRDIGDPLWPMPLWEGYRHELASAQADLNNTGTGPAGAITAALFLDHFVPPNIDWLHIDHYAWEQTGRPGRPRGGADMGLRAVFALLEQRYKATKPKAKR